MSLEKKQISEMKKFVKSNTFPKTVGAPEGLKEYYHMQFLQGLGFAIKGEEGNFWKIKLPKGWRWFYNPLFSSTWAYLIDDREAKRCAVLYQFFGYFYDEHNPKKKIGSSVSSHVNWMARYKIMVDHVVGFDKRAGVNNDNHYNSPLYGKVVDERMGEFAPLFVTEPIPFITKYSVENLETYYQEKRELHSKLYSECEEYLKKNYPEYDSVLAYW